MAKTLKVLLALALALTLVFSMAACGEKEDKNEGGSKTVTIDNGTETAPENETTAEPEAATESETAEDTLESFLNAVCELRLVDAGEYTTDADAFVAAVFGEAGLPSDVNGIDDAVDALMATFGGDEIANVLGDDFVSFMEDMFAEMLGTLSYTYEVKEEVSDEEVVYNVVLISPDFEEVSEIIGGAFENPEVSDAMMEEVMALYESGAITEDMSEEELMAAVMPLVMDVVEDVVDEALVSVETVDTEMEMTLIKDGGKWLISVE